MADVRGAREKAIHCVAGRNGGRDWAVPGPHLPWQACSDEWEAMDGALIMNNSEMAPGRQEVAVPSGKLCIPHVTFPRDCRVLKGARESSNLRQPTQTGRANPQSVFFKTPTHKRRAVVSIYKSRSIPSVILKKRGTY